MHKDFMLAALEQAWQGRGICAPNPSVGAIAVHNDKIIASAWHKGVGTAHAEQLLLKQIPAGLKNVRLYVTLEPCNHWGRTPPCVSAIIDYGVAEVIYGFRDPNPIVIANNTPELLVKNDIQCLHYPLAEVEAFYQSYCYWTYNKKPWVTAKIAHTLDGKIAGVNGQRFTLSNNLCAEFTHKQRLYSDVILTTAKTIKQDDPQLNVRLQEKVIGKVIAIIDRNLTLDKQAKIFSTAEHCHIYYDQELIVKDALPHCTYHAISSKTDGLDLTAIISHLGALGFHDVWVEAGGLLFSALHRENLVNRSYLYIVPSLLGANATPAFHGEASFTTKPHDITWQIKANNVIACINWQENRCLQD